MATEDRGRTDGDALTDRPFRGGSRVRTERSAKRVRAYVGGQVVFDTTRPLLVWEKRSYPTYYIPVDDLLADLVATGASVTAIDDTTGRTHDLLLGGVTVPGSATTFPEAHDPALLAHARIGWDAMDAWFEEDEQVFVHPRDPYTRIDALRSSRHVVVEVEGIVLAESRSPVVLHETGLIPRYYLPPTDLRRELFVPSDTITHCPYKGSATYLSVRGDRISIDDLAWSYPFPTRESAPIAGMVAFPDERVDIILDGIRQSRPSSPRIARADQSPDST